MMLYDPHEAPRFSKFDMIELHGKRFGPFCRGIFGSRQCMIHGRNCRRHSGDIHPHGWSEWMLMATPAVLSAVTGLGRGDKA